MLKKDASSLNPSPVVAGVVNFVDVAAMLFKLPKIELNTKNMIHLLPSSFLSLFVFILPLSAADYYVSPGGNDSATGAITEPWATFTKAISELSAGDTLMIRGGSYAEKLQLNGLSGTALAPIVISNFTGETVIIDGSTLTVPTSSERDGLVVIQNCNYLHLKGITAQKYKTSSQSAVPVGIQIEGACKGITVSECTVAEIWQSSTETSANGFGISVYGTSPTSSIDGLTLAGNTVHDLRTGQSESVVLNGNVTNFTVTKNHIYNCNNIGIDFIGYEDTVADETLDRARHGVCRENHVHGINSAFNPGYEGDFTNGGGDASAAGIYVDGGHDILIERNHVHECNFGIELASEDKNGFTENVIMRNNLIHHNLSAGIIMGGYDKRRGVTRNCQVVNNTIYLNDTMNDYSGEIALQFYLESNVFKNNIIWVNPTTNHAIVHYVETGTATQKKFDIATNIFDYNIYYTTGNAEDLTFGLNLTGSENASFEGLPAWRTALGGGATGDGAHSLFINPGFITLTPSATATADDFKLSPTSSSINAGEPAASYTPGISEKDYSGASRVASARIDAGCYEYMSAIQIWRDTHFSLPDGDGGASNHADDEDDPDADGVNNLLEYSQGMDPNTSDAALGPQGALNGMVYRFSYRKEAADLNYELLTATDDLSDWQVSTLTEQTDNHGEYWHEVPVSNPASFFMRLKISDFTP